MITIAADKTAPTILETEQVTATTAKVKFSEPMKSLGTVSFKLENGKEVTGITGTLTAGDEEIVYNLAGAQVDGTDAAIGTKIVITFTGAQDQADNIITPNPVSVTFEKGAKDGIAPEVVSITQTGAITFEIKFSEEIVKPTNTDLTVTKGSTPNAITKVVKDKNDLTVYEFTVTSPLEGVTTIATASGQKILDLSGEELEFSRVVTFVKDEEKPAVKSTKIIEINGEENLEITFDKNVKLTTNTSKVKATGSHVKDYETTDLTGTSAQDITYKNVNVSKKVLVIPVKTLLLPVTNDIKNAVYTVDLEFTSVLSEADVNAEVAKDITFTREGDGASTNKDKIEIAYTSGVAKIVQDSSDNNIITVEFTEDVDGATGTNSANYKIDHAVVKSANIMSGTPKVVVLTLEKDSNAINGLRNITIENIKAKGSTITMDKYVGAVDLDENVRPTIEKAELIADNKIQVTFSEKVYGSVDTAGVDFDLYIGGIKSNNKLKAEVVAKANAKVKIVLSIEDGSTNDYSLTADDLAEGVTIKFVSDSAIVDEVGNGVNSTTTITVK